MLSGNSPNLQEPDYHNTQSDYPDEVEMLSAE